MAERAQRTRTRGGGMPEGAVYVGRPGRWGNPFQRRPGEPATAVVEAFRDQLLHGGLDYTPDDVRRELAGKNLACWCPLDQPCHADVLLQIANDGQPHTTNDDRVRSLTVIPPWSLAIVQGHKPIENRPRNLAGTWRGRVLILSSAGKWDPVAARFIAARTTTPPPTRDRCYPGHYIGAVDLIGAHPAAGRCCQSWGEQDVWHLTLTNPVEFAQPIRGTGHLGLRRVTDPALIRAAAGG